MPGLIKIGGGNHPKLSEQEQIILMLVYLRHNLTLQLLDLLFQVSESTDHNLFNYWQKIFEGKLTCSLLKPVRNSPEEVEEVRPSHLIAKPRPLSLEASFQGNVVALMQWVGWAIRWQNPTRRILSHNG